MAYDENLNDLSKIEIYAEIILGILSYTNVKNTHDEESYRKEITKKLKFQNETDFELLRSCIDLIEDSQYAINEVYQNGLKTNEKFYGEMYLRLYGVLNAIYLQQNALIDLMRLFNIKNQKEKRNLLKNSKIIEFRNKIGSHTTSYIIPNTKETDFYRIAQSTITKWGKSLLIVGKNDSEEFDLIKNIKEFTLEAEKILDEIVSKELYNRTFQKEHFEWLENRYLYIKNYL